MRPQKGRQALRDLCESYYEPVALFIQRSGLTGHNEARDLAHEFFARLLEGDQLDQVDRTRGRFRSYLLGALKHFLSDHRGHYIIENIIEDGLRDFFENHLIHYKRTMNTPIHFVGSIADVFKDKIDEQLYKKLMIKI